MYKLRRKLYSQNFLFNRSLVKKLIRNSFISKSDTVLEIGPGRGVITEGLLEVSRKVIAIELDLNLFRFLIEKFRSANNLELYHGNFLNFKRPTYPYKVFSNIPFIITADVVRKLTSDDNFQEGYLIVQKEAAKKFIGIPFDYRNQMMAALLRPWFEIEVFWNFRRFDFIPTPKIGVVMIKIKKRQFPIIPETQKEVFRDFVIYKYSRSKIARLRFEQVVLLFDQFLKDASLGQKRVVASEARKFLAKQETIQKIHRTRTDKNWREY